jgi:hypothetical protein
MAYGSNPNIAGQYLSGYDYGLCRMLRSYHLKLIE